MPVEYDTTKTPEDYTASEQQMVDAINAAGERSEDVLKAIAFGLAGAFLLYRGYMKRRLAEQVLEDPRHTKTADAFAELAIRTSSAFMSKWIPTLAVNLAMGYTEGLKDVGGDPAWAQQASVAYAKKLGPHINDVSVQAVVEGVRAQVNRGVPIRMAVDRTIDAFGVAPKTMKALVNLWTKKPEPKTTSRTVNTRSLKDIVDSRVAQAINQRAQVVGESESYLSYNAAKAMYWAYQAEHGELPPTSEKEWITAADERTCPVCAPLHGTRVLVSEKFESSIGPILAPGIHPRCRCELRLHLNLDFTDLGQRDNLTIAKAFGKDKFDRDKNGKFAVSESRGDFEDKPTHRFRIYGDQAVQRAEEKQEQSLVLKPVFQSPLKQEGLKPALKLTPLAAVAAERAKQENQVVLERAEELTRSQMSLEQYKAAAMERVELKVKQVDFMLAHDVKEAKKQASEEVGIHVINGFGEHTEVTDYAHAHTAINYRTSKNIMYKGEELFQELVDWAGYSEVITEDNGVWTPRSFKVDDEEDDEYFGNEYYDEFVPVNMRNGTVAYISASDIEEMTANTYAGDDDMVEVLVAPTGRGHSTNEAGHARFATSELLAQMGSVGDQVIDYAVRSRNLAVITSADNPIGDERYESIDLEEDSEFTPIGDVFEQMVENPWREKANHYAGGDDAADDRRSTSLYGWGTYEL